jgi:hypothetical protein
MHLFPQPMTYSTSSPPPKTAYFAITMRAI